MKNRKKIILFKTLAKIINLIVSIALIATILMITYIALNEAVALVNQIAKLY